MTCCVVVSSSTSVAATGTSCKNSVAVMKISKRIKEKKNKTYRGLETQMRIESSIPIQQSPQRRCPQLVGDCRYGRCAFGRTWWWEGGRTREARDNDERKFEHALN